MEVPFFGLKILIRRSEIVIIQEVSFLPSRAALFLWDASPGKTKGLKEDDRRH